VKWSTPPEGRDEEQIEFSWAGETARHVGTVVHRWLQRIADDELEGWDVKRVDGLVGTFRRDLRRRGVRASDSYTTAELVRTALKNSLSDERGRWVLGPHPEAHTEHRLRVRTRQGVRSYIIDRTFLEAPGERWIVDFKTGQHQGGEIEVFLTQEAERYSPQLRAYGTAAASRKLGLYFPMLRAWVEVPRSELPAESRS